jgi:DNA (cytosine-5)-methyltransferase 1
MTTKILNLYAGIGGNRKLWTGDIEVTAVEIDKEIAAIYQTHFPQDKVIVGDAHQYLLDHYKEFDFIWSSPPCQTHSGVNHFLNAQGVIRYPDMALWQEIVFLKHFYKGKYVVENVEIYYDILIEPFAIGRHFFWSNFNITEKKVKMEVGRMNGSNQSRIHTKRKIDGVFDLEGFKVKNKEQLLNNCVNPELGLHILDCAFRQKQKTLAELKTEATDGGIPPNNKLSGILPTIL